MSETFNATKMCPFDQQKCLAFECYPQCPNQELLRLGIRVQVLKTHQDEFGVVVIVRGFKGKIHVDDVVAIDFEVLKEALIQDKIDADSRIHWRPNPVSYIRSDGMPVLTPAAMVDIDDQWMWEKIEALENAMNAAVRRVIQKLTI